MRSLVISLSCLLCLFLLWGWFMYHSENELDYIENELQQTVIPFVQIEEWEHAVEEFDKIYVHWKENMNTYSYFLDRSAVIQADFSFSLSRIYMEEQDLANAMAELTSLSKQLHLLYTNEKVTLENIL